MKNQVNVLLLMVSSLAISRADYWTDRKALIEEENEEAIGGRLVLGSKESKVNDILMRAKAIELERGLLNPSGFAPARNFLESKKDIEKSEVFKIIKKMPKGGVLHTHSSSIVSNEYLFDNVTYRDNLWACELNDGSLALKFFAKPNNKCEWKLLSEIRKNPGSAKTVDERIRRQLSMEDPSQNGTGFKNGLEAWVKFISIYDFVHEIINYRAVREDYFYQGLQELYDDNVFYLELRSALLPMYDLDGAEYSEVEVAKLLKKVSERFARDHPKFVGMKLIYAATKVNDSAQVEKIFKTVTDLKTALPNFFVGFDLDGHEEKYPKLTYFVEKLLAIAPTINFFFHAAESKWNGMKVDENLVDAIMLNTTRIGHGFGLTRHPKLLNIAKSKKIALEVSPISNQVLCLVDDLRNHPANTLMVTNFPIVISNDNPALWGVKGLSYDFYEAFMGMMSAHSDLRALKQLAINSITFSSLNREEKARAMSMWEEQWKTFIDHFNSTG